MPRCNVIGLHVRPAAVRRAGAVRMWQRLRWLRAAAFVGGRLQAQGYHPSLLTCCVLVRPPMQPLGCLAEFCGRVCTAAASVQPGELRQSEGARCGPMDEPQLGKTQPLSAWAATCNALILGRCSPSDPHYSLCDRLSSLSNPTLGQTDSVLAPSSASPTRAHLQPCPAPRRMWREPPSWKR